MYQTDCINEWLYPGDIIKELKLPNLKTEDYKMILSSQPKDYRTEYSVRKYRDNLFFAYLSHECDSNDNKRQFFLTAPLIHVNEKIKNDPIEYELLKNSNNVIKFPSYLTYFYFVNHDLLGDEFIVDFTMMHSIPSKMKNELYEKKILQLSQENRKLLKMKLAYYFSHSHET